MLHGPPLRRRKLAPALSSPPNASVPSSRPATNHLKADRDLLEPAPEPGDDAVDDAARHHRLADAGAVRPGVAGAAEQIGDRHREEVVGVQQPLLAGDDPVAVGVRVVGERHVEPILERDQPRHRVRRGAVHPDLAVVVERHERERRVDAVVDDLEVEPVTVSDHLPVGKARAAQRIDPEPDPGARDLLDVDHRGQVPDVGGAEVVAARALDRLLEWQALDPAQPRPQQLVRRVLDLPRDAGVGWPAMRRVVLEAAVLGRVVRRRDHDPVRPRPATRIMRQDRVRDRRRRRISILGIDRDLDTVRDEHLDRGPECRRRQRVRVAPQEQRTGNPLRSPVACDRLRDRNDVRLGERPRQRGAPVPRCSERHRLRRVRRIRMLLVIGPDQPIHIDEHLRGRPPNRGRCTTPAHAARPDSTMPQ